MTIYDFSCLMTSYERFINACLKKPVDRPPVWLMRQAGRYLPEYRHMRAKYDFAELCKTPSLACEISLQPWMRFQMDAVIVFSDILFVLEAIGFGLKFHEDKGPSLSAPDKLKDVDPKEAFSFVYSAIREIKRKLPPDVPLIGFSGAPWTLAHYMNEKPMRPKTKSLLTDIISEYVALQQEAGADVIQLFDTWAGELTTEEFCTIELPCIKKIIENGKRGKPFIIYTKKCRHILSELSECGADVVSIDQDTPMNEAIKRIGGRCAIQGNLDPKILATTPGNVKKETSKLLSKIKSRTGHIVNLGHGVLPTTGPDCVEAFVETVKGFS